MFTQDQIKMDDTPSVWPAALLAAVFAFGFFACGFNAWASIPGSPESSAQRPLNVTGQSRNLNMMLVLRNDQDKIRFVEVRQNYRREIALESGQVSGSEKMLNAKEQPKRKED